MRKRAESPPIPEPIVPRVPAWATPRFAPENDVEAASLAGSALNSLDNLIRSDPDWQGVWRHRLALTAAAAAVKLAGRREEEAALRDAWHLRAPGSDAGPAGNILFAWRRLCERSSPPDEDGLRGLCELLAIGWTDTFDELPELFDELSGSTLPAPLLAARIAGAVMKRQPKAELLAWWFADLTLAARMRWSLPVPVLSTQIHSPLLRLGEDRRRARPGDALFERAACTALALGAAEACKLAAAISAQAQRLREVEPKLRAKGAGDVIERLLGDDAVSGALTTPKLSRWASRRLFDRLQQFGVVRELTGRDSFRLFGL